MTEEGPDDDYPIRYPPKEEPLTSPPSPRSGDTPPALVARPGYAPNREDCRICKAEPGGLCPYHTPSGEYPPCEECHDPFSCHFTDDGDRAVGLEPSAGCGAFCDSDDHDHTPECPCDGYKLKGFTMDGWPDEPEQP
jgi:hypothetical protein